MRIAMRQLSTYTRLFTYVFTDHGCFCDYTKWTNYDGVSQQHMVVIGP